MAGYKHVKQKRTPKGKWIEQSEKPKGEKVEQGEHPEQFYDKFPSWNFSGCDKEKWSIYSEEVRKIFFSELLPRMSALESQLWSRILVAAKKENHRIEVAGLNKVAVERLKELKSEADAVYSLRVNATHRLYGHLNNGVFNILWVDLGHGDNPTCICRSYKKHT